MPQKHWVRSEICTLRGVILTQAGNSKTASVCRLVRTAWKRVYPTARGTESYHIGIKSLPLEWRSSQILQYQADPSICQGLKRKHLAVADFECKKEKLHKQHLSFLIRCLLAPAELSIYQEKWHCSPLSVHKTI